MTAVDDTPARCCRCGGTGCLATDPLGICMACHGTGRAWPPTDKGISRAHLIHAAYLVRDKGPI